MIFWNYLKKKNNIHRFSLTIILLAIPFAKGFSMHIMEGYLPVSWSLAWWIFVLPFIGVGIRRLGKHLKEHPEHKMLWAMVAAFTFVLSALKLPSVTGSCSHPTGTGLGAILFGPFYMVVVGFVVLIFQALMLAHGGISTLGANTFSMALAGPLVTWGIFKLFRRANLNQRWGIFLGAMLGDLATYMVTAFQLALAHPDPSGGLGASFLKFSALFAPTQVPLAIGEGLLTVLVCNILASQALEYIPLLQSLKRK